MIKDDIQASINMCIALEIKNKIKLTGVIDTLKRAQKEHELLGLYRKYLKYVNVDDIRYMQIANKIEQKEKELEELK